MYYANETLVLPTSPERGAQTALGLLVQNDDTTAPPEARLVYVRLEDRVPSALRCACSNQPGACRIDVAPLVVRAVHDGETTVVTWNETPVAEVGGDACTCFTTEGQAHMEEAGDGECGEYLEHATPVALIGGELQTEIEIGDIGCDGTVQPEVGRVALFEGARGVVIDEDGEPRCLRGDTYEPSQLGTARRVSCEAAGDDDDGDDDDDDDDGDSERAAMCEACEHAHASYQLLSRGRLFSVATLSSYDMEALAVRSQRATNATCPDPSDTCGDPSGLPIPPGADFWVARDGERALVHYGDRWLVVNRGRVSAAAIHVRPLGRPIGVRFHADVRPILTELERGLLIDASDTLPVVAEARVPTSDRCESDEDCLLDGECGGYCSSHGHCFAHGEGCDENHDCEASSSVCQLDVGDCVEPDTLRPSARDQLAREDARYARAAPADQGRGWARRCHAHLTRGRIDEAYAACVRAIALDPSDRVMSGVLGDLATIYGRRGREYEADAFQEYADMYDESAAEEEEAAPPPPSRRPRRQR